VILALEMGLGKTLISLSIAKSYILCGYKSKIVVICPSSLKDNWKIEAGYLGLDIDVYSWNKQPLSSTYDDFILIADESHYIQSGDKTKRGREFLELSKKARFNLLLSGTPMRNGKPVHLFPLLKVCNHHLSKDKRHYEKRYCDAKRTYFSRWDTTGSSNLEELAELTKNIILRKNKSELNLPELTRIFHKIELSVNQRKIWNEKVYELNETIDKDKEGWQLVFLGKLKKLSSQFKFDKTREIISDILEQGDSVVIFTEFIETAEHLCKEFDALLLTGSTPVNDRQSLVNEFQRGLNRVFVSTTQAGGVGITLTKSSYVIMHDRPWTPGDVSQCEARIHRIGSKNPCFSIWIQFDQIDYKIDSMLSEKQKNIDTLLGENSFDIIKVSKSIVNNIVKKLK
jgi:SNF2 family DNA or RNA helicase